jgi:hypothetical protein
MRRLATGVVPTLLLVACICPAQPNHSHYIEIKLSPGIISERVFIRYLLTGDDFGDWVQPRPGISSYFISTTHAGRPATRIKALLYAPGCAIRTLDLPVSGSTNPPYSFICQPLPNISITGTLTAMDRLYHRDLKIQARYVARWAASFFDLDPYLITAVPVGEAANVSPDGHFLLSVPDFSLDPLAASPQLPGELQIWAIDKPSNQIVAELILTRPESLKTRMAGLKIQSEYPPELIFGFCAADYRRPHDAFGFAFRQDDTLACDR